MVVTAPSFKYLLHCQILPLKSRDSLSIKRLHDERGLPKSIAWDGLEEKDTTEGPMIIEGLYNEDAAKLQSAVQQAMQNFR